MERAIDQIYEVPYNYETQGKEMEEKFEEVNYEDLERLYKAECMAMFASA